MLEAYWGHRVSTDVYLFIAPKNLAVAYDRHNGLLYQALTDALRDAGASFETIWQRRSEVFLQGEYSDGTPWSFSEMHAEWQVARQPCFKRRHPVLGRDAAG